MRKIVAFCFLCVLLGGGQVSALSDAEVADLKNKTLLYSSPFEKGDKAIKFKVDDIFLSRHFDDDGMLVINNRAYPIDQLFMENIEGKYENLAYLLNYDGVATTYFIRYFDENRLALRDEINHLKQLNKNCVDVYNGHGVAGVADEAAQYDKCLDSVFLRIVNLFYTKSDKEIRQNYEAQSVLWKKLYFDFSNPDNCYGQCGTIAEMQAYGKAIEAKQRFIADMLEGLEVFNK